MPINFQCDKCNNKIVTAGKNVGSTVKCPGCQGDVLVPNPNKLTSPVLQVKEPETPNSKGNEVRIVPADEIEWYYAIDNQKTGPVKEGTIKQLIAAGTVTAMTRVWREGMQGWAKLSDTELKSLCMSPRTASPLEEPHAFHIKEPEPLPAAFVDARHGKPLPVSVVKSSVLAITSLICGILSLICGGPFLGIPAIIIGVLAIGKIKKGIGSGKGLAVSGIATGSAGTIIAGIVLISIIAGISSPKNREIACRISCASNLKQIGLAVRMYSMENKEQFPYKNGAEGLEMLRAGGYLENKKMYTCPSTGTVPAGDGGKLTEDNVDYVYVAGYNESVSPDTAIAYDRPYNHIKFGNILFADGHVAGFAGENWMDNIKK